METDRRQGAPSGHNPLTFPFVLQVGKKQEVMSSLVVSE